jgi:hypothetical protein
VVGVRVLYRLPVKRLDEDTGEMNVVAMRFRPRRTALNQLRPRVVNKGSGERSFRRKEVLGAGRGFLAPALKGQRFAMRSLTASLPVRVAIRVGVSATLAVSGVIHAYLYVQGYSHIPMVGPAFLVQAIMFCALAVLILAAGWRWLQWAGGVVALGSLIAFVLSRTVGLFGFTEYGWQPSPQAALSVIAEVLTVVLVAASVPSRRSKSSRV